MSGGPVMYKHVDRQLRRYGWRFRYTGYSDDSYYYMKDGYAVIVFVNLSCGEIRCMSLINDVDLTNRYIMTTDEKSGLFDMKVPYGIFMDTVRGESSSMYMRIENAKTLMALEGLQCS